MFPLRSPGLDPSARPPSSRSPAGAPRAGSRLALPSLCAVCHQWGRERVCAACIARFARRLPRCARCAIEVPDGVSVCGACIANPPAFDHALAAVDYAFPWDGLIARFKFHDAIDLAAAFARRIVEAQRASGLPAPSLIVPVPLSGARLRERGFNQAWELARRAAGELRCAADATLLLRVKDTPHQLALPLERRAGNVRGAFAVEPLRRRELHERCVAVVDDVVTTGATGAEIARVLRDSGAAQVQIWAFARTPRPADS